MKKVIVYTDGGSRSNPGKAASACVATDCGTTIFEEGKYLGIATNNEAEYQAVILALEKLSQEYDPANLDVEIKSDSRLVVEQLSGNFKVKHPRIKELFNEVKNLEPKFGSVTYTLIPREQNFQADLIVNRVLDRNS